MILNWIQKNSDKKIILSKSDYSYIKNKIRNLKGVQSLYFSSWLNIDNIISNDQMFASRLIYRFRKYLSNETNLLTDDLFLSGIKNGKQYILKNSRSKIYEITLHFPTSIKLHRV